MTWISGGRWLEHRRSQALLAIFLALPYLLRHNGLALLLLVSLALLIFYRMAWKAILAVAVAATALVIGVRFQTI